MRVRVKIYNTAHPYLRYYPNTVTTNLGRMKDLTYVLNFHSQVNYGYNHGHF